MTWLVVSGSDRRALDLVDGVGRWEGHGPHYSRRTPGAPIRTGDDVMNRDNCCDGPYARADRPCPSCRFESEVAIIMLIPLGFVLACCAYFAAGIAASYR